MSTLAKEHAVDLSDQSWVKDTDYAISIDGKTYGYPVSEWLRLVADLQRRCHQEDHWQEFKPRTTRP